MAQRSIINNLHRLQIPNDLKEAIRTVSLEADASDDVIFEQLRQSGAVQVRNALKRLNKGVGRERRNRRNRR